MTKHKDHLTVTQYSELLPEDTFLHRDLANKRFEFRVHADGKPEMLREPVPEGDVLRWTNRKQTFAFAARHALRQWRASRSLAPKSKKEKP